MILDASAIISILIKEPGSDALSRKIGDAHFVGMGAPTMFETTLALSNKLGIDAFPMVELFVRQCGIHVLPFTHEHMRAAVGAFHRFGKGRHRAKLNLGDCMTYATASIAAMPLLFTGGDFTFTDLEAA